MRSFEKVFFVVVVGRLPVARLYRKFSRLRRQWRNFLQFFIMIEDSIAMCVIDLLIIMLVVVIIVIAHDVVGALIVGAWMMVENHCRVCGKK